MPIDWPPFVDIVHGANRFLLTCHIRPDCDCLGSELGMAGVLESLGKEVLLVNGQATPPNLAFIDPATRIRVLGEDVSVEQIKDAADVMMILDTSSWAQIGPMGEVVKQTSAQVVVLDHHRIGDDLGAIEFKDTDAEAAGRLVLEAAEALGVKVTPEIAMPLFAAIATDTGWFRFGSVCDKTYQAAAKLFAAGARPAEIYKELYERDTLGRVRLRGRILDRLVCELDGRLIHTYVPFSDFAETGAIPPDTEDAINLALTVEGTQFAVIGIEQENGEVKFSFRSRTDLDCSTVAKYFGGGGHKAAAGASLPAPLEDALGKVLAYVREQLSA